MEVPVGIVILGLVTVLFGVVRRASPSHDMWDEISVRYNLWYRLPRTVFAAKEQGYHRMNSICKTNGNTKYHGFLYRRHDDTKALPIYDSNGWIVGLQTMIPSNLKGYDSLNNSIRLPPSDVMPPILVGEIIDGLLMYTVTAYFRHPELVCNPFRKGVPVNRGLYIQTGLDLMTQYLEVPLNIHKLRHSHSLWKQGSCIPTMGKHYFLNMTNTMLCERLFPLFLMYGTDGQLGAYGWAFQGRPFDISESEIKWFKVSPATYAFLFDTQNVPACMMNPKFRIFGIHVWLKDSRSAHMTCPLEVPLQDPTNSPPSQLIYQEYTTIKDPVFYDSWEWTINFNRSQSCVSDYFFISLLFIIINLFIT